MLQIPRTGIVLPEKSLRIEHFANDRFDIGLECFHPGGGNLPDHHIAIAIEHETR
jgi:hypothetical protein